MESVFEGPIVTSPASADHRRLVSWLDIVEFATKHPDQFVPRKDSEGQLSCRILINGVQVSILEDDWRLIASGALERFSMLSNSPTEEDEGIEVATLDIVEKRLETITKKAEEIAKRAHQLSHRLSSRKAMIKAKNPMQASNGFESINPRRRQMDSSSDLDVQSDLLQQFDASAARFRTFHASPASPNMGQKSAPVRKGSSASVNPRLPSAKERQPSVRPSRPSFRSVLDTPLTESFDSSTAHKSEMTSHITGLGRGDEIRPPCDRCRRRKSPCIKHLTACQGCTKKHAKCAWKTITEEEVASLRGDSSASKTGADKRGSAEPEESIVLRHEPPHDGSRRSGNEFSRSSRSNEQDSRSESRASAEDL